MSSNKKMQSQKNDNSNEMSDALRKRFVRLARAGKTPVQIQSSLKIGQQRVAGMWGAYARGAYSHLVK